jgi:hypothetical protein
MRAPRELKIHTPEEIEPRRQLRDGLVRVAERERLVLRSLAAPPEERLSRTR